MLSRVITSFHGDDLRRLRAKSNATIVRYHEGTNNQRTTLIGTGNNLGVRPQIRGSIIKAAGDAPINNNAGAQLFPGSVVGNVAILPARIVDNGAAAAAQFTCPMTIGQLGLLANPVYLAIRITKPDEIVANDADSYWKVIGVSGNAAALAEANWIAIDLVTRIPITEPMIIVSNEEAELANDDYASFKGKISNNSANEPAKKILRVLGTTSAKEASFKRLSTFKHIIGLRKFVEVFVINEAMAETTDWPESDTFTLTKVTQIINDEIQNRLDSKLMHNGCKISNEKKAAAFATLNFGSKPEQISSGDFIHSSEVSNSTSPISTNQAFLNTTFFCDVLEIIFSKPFVEAVREMIKQVKDRLKPKTGAIFNEMVDALIQAAAYPPLDVNTSEATYIAWCKSGPFDTSNNNPLVGQYKEEQLAKEQQAYDQALQQSQRQLAELQEQMKQTASRGRGNGAASGMSNKPSFQSKNNGKKRPFQALTGAALTSAKEDYDSRMAVWKTEMPDDCQLPAGQTMHLCHFIAKDPKRPCPQKTKGRCKHLSHDIQSWMSPAYIAWAKHRPSFRKHEV